MKEGPWFVMGALLVMKTCHPQSIIRDFDFHFTEFWVQLWGLPLDMMTKNNSWRIGMVVGEPNQLEEFEGEFQV